MRLPSRLEQLETNLEKAYRLYEQYRGDLLDSYHHKQKASIKFDMDELLNQIEAMERDWARQMSPIVQKIELSTQDAEPLAEEWLQATENAIHRYEDNTELHAELHQLRNELQTGKAASAKLKVTLPIVPLLIHYEMELDTESTLIQLWQKTRDFFKKETAKNP